jgi:hypothetical protein
MKREQNEDESVPTLQAIEKILPLADKMRQDRMFFQGIALGLFYGIFGNIFVSHYYRIFEGLVLGQIDNLFWMNVVALIIVMIVMSMVSLRYIRKYRTLKRAEHQLSAIIESVRKR